MCAGQAFEYREQLAAGSYYWEHLRHQIPVVMLHITQEQADAMRQVSRTAASLTALQMTARSPETTKTLAADLESQVAALLEQSETDAEVPEV